MRKVLFILILLLIIYLLLAYVILPWAWKHYEHNPELEAYPKTTFNSLGQAGDPLNIALVATEDELINAFLLAHWTPADPITFSSSRKIVWSVLEKKSYPSAPVSNLFLFGRKQDLAFEKEHQNTPKQRHHVRFWKTNIFDKLHRPLWIGAATFDESVGLSHYTGQITHHIAPNIDEERDEIIQDLSDEGQLLSVYEVSGVGPTLHGKNGGGDSYYTDGEIRVGVISPDNKAIDTSPQKLANPWQIDLKNKGWDVLQPLLEKINASEP